MAGQHICDDMKEYNMTEEMAENQSVWHMKTKAGPLLHGGIHVGEKTYMSYANPRSVPHK